MMKPYDSYKITNIPWVKEIPCHWELIRNKNVLTEQKDVVGSKSSDYDLLSLTLKGVILRDMENAKGKFPKDFDTYKIVKKDNIIFCLFDVDETPRTVGFSSYNGMITGAYDVFSVSGISKGYLYYYYLSIDNVKAMKPLYTGLRKVIGVPTFFSTKLPLPPRTEQDQIVRFLDWKLSKINKLINAKKRQIELLKEQREYHLFFEENYTKKLCYWDSCFPTEWKMINAQKLFEEVNVKEIPNLELGAVTQNRGIIYKKDCNQNYVSPNNLAKQKYVGINNFVISLRSFQGGIETSDIECIVSPAYTVFRLKSEYEQYQSFFRCLFKTKPFISHLNTLVSDIRDGKKISFDKFKDIMLPLTSLKCLEEVKKLSFEINCIENNNDVFINLLHEYRTKLISDVVTGKVDVRDVVVPEFETVEEVSEDTEEIDVVLETEEE